MHPVGNGDTTQIVLSGGRRVLFDFCHRNKAEDSDTPEIDLKARLKDDLKKAERDYFDVVAFTHADLDHIQGSTDFFELQHAKKYHGEGRVKLRELWVPAAMLLEEPSRRACCQLHAFKRSLSAGILDGSSAEVSLGGSRLSRFMKDVENVTGRMGNGEAMAPAEEAAQLAALELAAPVGATTADADAVTATAALARMFHQ